MRVIRRTPDSAGLGPYGEDREIVHLRQLATARPVPRRGLLGLYHFAILLPDRPTLGRFVQHLAESNARAGGSDHLVSEAFYLTDPDGLGIEVYADRPRSTWRRVGEELMISTDPIDVAGLVEAAGHTRWSGMPPGTVIGHVHLHVGDLTLGSAFFSDALGFDRMTWRYPGALFLGAGGYHHHLGTNTWAGAGARPPGDGDAGLLEWSIEVPTPDDVAAVTRSLQDAGHPVEVIAPGEARTRDPWGTHIRLCSAGDEVVR